MGKLFQLKKWLTLGDAAKRLSASFGEPVGEADVLLLALDGHLKLSVLLVNAAYGRPCFPTKPEDIEWKEVTALDGKNTIKIPKNGRVWQDDGGTFQVARFISQLEAGIWDLPMTGGERLDVQQHYQSLTHGHEVTAISLDGVLLASTSGDLYEVQSHFSDNEHFDRADLKEPFLHYENFHPAGSLPNDSVFVVRTDALLAFEQSLQSAPSTEEKPLSPRERTNLLSTIGALLELIDTKEAAIIDALVQKYPDKPGIKKRTLEEKFAEAKRCLGAS